MQNKIPMKSSKELSDEEFLVYYKEKYPEEYAKLMQEAYNENTIKENNSNNNEIKEKEKEEDDIEKILRNKDITNSSPLEFFLCLTKTYNDFFPFFKRQGVFTLEQAISFKNYSVKNSKAHFNFNFNKEKEFLEINFRNIRNAITGLDKYQQIIFLLQSPLKYDGSEIVLDSQLILKSFINGTSTPNFCKMNKFQTQNLKPSSLYSANLQKFKITQLPKNKIDGFVNLKNLYLDSNRIQEIKGLFFPNLEELNLSDNYIRKIENLEGCPKLKILNLSYNNIHILENIQNNIYLENINLSNQYIPNFISFIIKPNNNPIKVLNLENVNRLSLANLPTPIQRLDRLSEEWGVDLWIKRDDYTGIETSGNKVRKLEYTIAKALEEKAEVVITCGGIQSNHCRSTAAVAARVGIKSHLVLRIDEQPPLEGNYLLDKILGAEITFITRKDYSNRRNEIMKEIADTYGFHPTTVRRRLKMVVFFSRICF